ncbi:TolC family protein [Spirosoma endophyticum]|uniref:Efflux transporter, outer membrane factor (OMF) lipoprotein, NodT family n=1 Tax=Spirosoma endophyticum TaxID=662367 RepID=A0A1I1F8U2_9BACT|nr:TolC family protein [Spirosoma endophyticum]SFB94118.1 efflux transporter, outer membrane factor (OMF) lipoprotein, NodT family [Spirosoma endophyticum]
MVPYLNKPKIGYRLGLLLFLVSLSGCRVMHTLPKMPDVSLPVSFAGSDDSTTIGRLPRQTLFADKNLVQLIDTALTQNPDLRMALQRIEMAQASFQISRGALLPSVNAVAAAGVDRYGKYTLNGVGNFDTNLSENIVGQSRIPNPTPDFFLGLRSSWELDIWGKLRNRRQAAYTRLLASQEGRNLVVTALTGEVARLYYTLLALDAELEIIRENEALQQRAVELVNVQKAAGRVTELAVQQFTAQLLNTRSREGGVRQEIVDAENQLNTLLGRYPQPIVRGQSIEDQKIPAQILAGLPSQLVRRRPDIRQAERELEAANVDIAVAQAEFLPSLTLTPYVGFNAFRVSSLLDPASIAAGAIGGLAAPIFNRRLLKGNYTISVARSREAYFAYQKTILTGVSEVVSSLKGLDNYRNVAELQRQEVAVLRQAATTSNELFVNGYATYLEVITAQRSVLDAELALIETKRSQFLSLVGLYRALGGGWE